MKDTYTVRSYVDKELRKSFGDSKQLLFESLLASRDAQLHVYASSVPSLTVKRKNVTFPVEHPTEEENHKPGLVNAEALLWNLINAMLFDKPCRGLKLKQFRQLLIDVGELFVQQTAKILLKMEPAIQEADVELEEAGIQLMNHITTLRSCLNHFMDQAASRKDVILSCAKVIVRLHYAEYLGRKHSNAQATEIFSQATALFPKRNDYSQNICWRYGRTGKCMYGAACFRRHVSKEALKFVQCPFYPHANCYFGERCMFSHDVNARKGGNQTSEFEGGVAICCDDARDDELNNDKTMILQNIGEADSRYPDSCPVQSGDESECHAHQSDEPDQQQHSDELEHQPSPPYEEHNEDCSDEAHSDEEHSSDESIDDIVKHYLEEEVEHNEDCSDEAHSDEEHSSDESIDDIVKHYLGEEVEHSEDDSDEEAHYDESDAHSDELEHPPSLPLEKRCEFDEKRCEFGEKRCEFSEDHHELDKEQHEVDLDALSLFSEDHHELDKEQHEVDLDALSLFSEDHHELDKEQHEVDLDALSISSEERHEPEEEQQQYDYDLDVHHDKFDVHQNEFGAHHDHNELEAAHHDYKEKSHYWGRNYSSNKMRFENKDKDYRAQHEFYDAQQCNKSDYDNNNETDYYDPKKGVAETKGSEPFATWTSEGQKYLAQCQQVGYLALENGIAKRDQARWRRKTTF